MQEDREMRNLLKAMAAAGLALLLATPAQALSTFDLAWSGEPFGNAASATGTITFDTAQVSGAGVFAPDLIVDAFMITVSGTASGDGTFGLANYAMFRFGAPAGTALDFSQELVGQMDPGGATFDPSGPPALSGDFNIFSNGGLAPTGNFFFRISTGGPSRQNLLLTSFAPSPADARVPAPAAAVGLLIGLGGLAALRRRRRA